MKGNCPSCNRSYEISDEFLAMGGKAKCPHCLLELEFKNKPERHSAENLQRTPTRADPLKLEQRAVSEPEELDATCESCGRSFKVDSQYLRMGGQANCPHCGTELQIISPRHVFERTQIATGSQLADAEADEGVDDYEADTDPNGFFPSDQETAKHATEERTDFLWDGDTQAQAEVPADPDEFDQPTHLDGDWDDVPAVSDDLTRDEEALPSLAEESTGDSFGLEEEKTVLVPESAGGRNVTEVLLDERSEFRRELPATEEDPDADQFSGPREVLEWVVFKNSPDREMDDGGLHSDGRENTDEDVEPDSFGDDDGTHIEPPQSADRDGGVFAEQQSSQVVIDDRAGGDETPQADQKSNGMFAGLASKEDWASAARRWAEGGFSTNEVPSFIRTEEEEPGNDDGIPLEEPKNAQHETMRDDDVLFDGDRSDALPAVAHDADLVEVSDADILMIEGEPSDPGKSIGGPSAEHQSGTRSRVFNDTTERIDREARDQVVLPESKKADRTSTPGLASRLLNPPVLAGVLGIGVLLIVTVLWVLLGAEENLEQRKFSVKDLQVELIQGPGPTPYLSDEKSVRHYGRGNRFAYLGQFELAIEEYRKASQLDSANPLPQRALGVMYAAMGQTRLSIEAYRAYLKMAPHSADAPLVRKIVKQASLGKSD